MGAGGQPERAPVPAEAQRSASLSDPEALELGRFAVAIEEHYSRRAGHAVPMDIEWAKDADDGRLYILQARPETVHTAARRAVLEIFSLRPGGPRDRLVSGAAIGQRIGVGPTRRLRDPHDLEAFQAGDVLVASMTDPDWEPIMKRAAAIVTDRGGRTCHAAIVEPRARRAVRGRHRQRDGAPRRRAARDRVLRRRRDRRGLRGRAVRRAPAGGPGRDAEDRDQGDAQCRQSRRGVPAGRPAQRRRGAGAHRVHHRQLRARASARAAPPGPGPRSGRAGGDRRADRRVCGPRGILRRAAGRRRGDDRGGLSPEGRDRPSLGLQVERVRGARGRSGLRARGRQSHARLPRRVPLRAPALPGGVRARVPGPAPGPRADGPHQREADDPVLPDPGRGPARARSAGRQRARARRERPRGLRDGRDSRQRDPGRRVRGALRRLLDRLQRSHPARARGGPGLGAGRARVRRAQSGGAQHDRHDHRRRAARGAQGRDLRPGAERLSRDGPVPRGARGSRASR